MPRSRGLIGTDILHRPAGAGIRFVARADRVPVFGQPGAVDDADAGWDQTDLVGTLLNLGGTDSTLPARGIGQP